LKAIEHHNHEKEVEDQKGLDPSRDTEKFPLVPIRRIDFMCDEHRRIEEV
jgi:hypothetical protein